MKRVRILLVGVCGYGGNYVKEIEENDIPDTEVTGVVEVRDDVYELFPVLKEKNIPVYKNLETFFEANPDGVDLTILSTPIHLHYEQIRFCLLKNSNVLTEKPVCTSVKGAEQLLEFEEKCGRFISVGYQLNYSRDILALKKDIVSGRFGEPLSFKALHAMRRGRNYYMRNSWAGRIEINGCKVNDSPFNNACAHQFQVMTFLLGNKMNEAAELKSVDGEVYRGNAEIENYDIAAIKAHTLSGVPILYYTAHALKEKKLGPYAEYKFSKGTVYFGRKQDGQDILEYIYVGNDGEVINYGNIDKGLRLQKLYDSIEAVRYGEHPVCTVQCAIPHLYAVEELAREKIHEISKEYVNIHYENDDTFYEVKDLKNILTTCYVQECLVSKIEAFHVL